MLEISFCSHKNIGHIRQSYSVFQETPIYFYDVGVVWNEVADFIADSFDDKTSLFPIVVGKISWGLELLRFCKCCPSLHNVVTMKVD